MFPTNKGKGAYTQTDNMETFRNRLFVTDQCGKRKNNNKDN